MISRKFIYIFIFVFATFALAVDKKSQENPTQSNNLYNKKMSDYKPTAFPKISPGEYAIYIDGRYEVFKTKTFENLELDLKCFKSGTPKCEAYSFSQMKPTSSDLEKNKIVNFAAAHCHAIYGVNLVALDHKKNEFNFCRFKDGSMVNSWSVFIKKSELIKNK